MTPTLNPNQIQIKKTTSGTFVICLVISLAIIFLLLMPKMKQYSANKGAYAAAQASYDTVKAQQNEVEALYIKIRNQKADLAKVDLALPNKSDISSVYALMERFAKSANLSLSSVQGVDDADKPPGEKTVADANPLSPSLGIITVNIQVTGSVEGFVQMLAAIEQSLRLVDVQSIDITQDKDQQDLSFRTTFKTYYQK